VCLEATNKRSNVFEILISNFFLARKMICATKGLCPKYWPFDCQKSFAYVVCEKCVVEMFDYAFVSKDSLSF
jgi:hypothetical protein